MTAAAGQALQATGGRTTEDDGRLLPGRVLGDLLAHKEADVGPQPRHEGCRQAAKHPARVGRGSSTILLKAPLQKRPARKGASSRVPGVMQLLSKRLSGSGMGSPRFTAASAAS